MMLGPLDRRAAGGNARQLQWLAPEASALLPLPIGVR